MANKRDTTWRQIQIAADRHVSAFRRMFDVAFAEARAAISLAKLEQAFATGDRAAVERLVLTALDVDELRNLDAARAATVAPFRALAGSPLQEAMLDVASASADATRCSIKPQPLSPSARAARAKETFKPSTATKQRRAEANEKVVARMVGGDSLPDDEPMDVVTSLRGRRHGVEVKTFVDNANDKITMHPESRVRKERWARKNKATTHTVLVDDRDLFSPEQFSGHKVYYARGTRAFRLRNMIPVRDEADLKWLMGLDRRALAKEMAKRLGKGSV